MSLDKESKVKRLFRCVLLIIVLVILDQLTKHLAVKYLMGNEGKTLIPGVLELLYLENTGIAFSLLKNQMVLFYIITVIISIAIIILMTKIPNNKRFHILYYLLGVLLAGALGNFIDRIVHHYVVDFIYFSLINFPVFNVADIYVTCSVIVLAILFIFYYKDEELSEIFEKKGD